jgi:long-chain fatty acid transport protein
MKLFDGIRCLAITILTLLLTPALSIAGNPMHGSKAAGMNTAFVGVVDDPSAILHNPAGLTLSKGTNIYLGGTAVILSSTYENDAGQSEKTEFQSFYVPHLYISSDFGASDIVFGIGVYSPFGLGGRKWPEDGLTRYASVESYTATFSLNPTVAWEVMPGLSIATGVDYMRAMNHQEKMIDQSSVSAKNAEISLDAEGDGWGYNLGALIALNSKLRLGLAYRSRIKVDYKGDLDVEGVAPALQPLVGSSGFNTDISTTSTFPEIYSIGIAYFPDEKIVLAFDVEWVRWSSFKKSDLDLEDEVPRAGLSDSSMRMDWKDSLQYKIGMEYRFNDAVSFRTGYAFIKTPVPETTLSADMPDSDQHNFSIGAGYRTGKWTTDVFYNAGYYEDRNVNNSILSGKYESFTHNAGMSIGYKF